MDEINTGMHEREDPDFKYVMIVVGMDWLGGDA